MYAIHTTPGFIIDSRPTGEAGKLISIFTRELGLVFASAQGLRLEKSKLRYHTIDYSFGTFSFVRGKEFWRLTSAAEEQKQAISGSERRSKAGSRKQEDRKTQEFFARIALLLRRFLHGEEPHPELFDVLESCRTFLADSQLSDEQLQTLESIVVLRILYSLGYVGKLAELDEYVHGPISTDLLERAFPLRKVINQHINKALKESQL